MTIAPPKPRRRTPIWAKLLLTLFVILLIVATGVGGLFLGKFLGADEVRTVQVVRSVQVEEQVILLTAGLSDEIPLRGEALDVFGLFDLPGSQRSTDVRIDFDGKFGIDGGDVEIEQTGETAYRITIPQFEYLGYDNPEFSVAQETNGVLSFTTTELDTLDAAEYALADEAAQQHIDGFRPLLEKQAEQFYTRIVSGIDPAITLEFVFSG